MAGGLPAGDGPAHARAFVRRWVPALTAAGIDTAHLDAELLVAHALSTTRDRLIIDDPLVGGPALVTAEQLLSARATERRPVAQLVGTRWFDGHAFAVTPDTLVPRPETELLVERAAELVPAGASVIDVGTGTGAVALALAIRRPDLELMASDVSAEALAVARGNAARLGVESPRVQFQEADLLGDWQGEVVVSNPPYVEDAWQQAAQPELAHEPAIALYAGADGLEMIRRLVDACAARPEVRLVLLEHGHRQGTAIRALLAAVGFPDATTEPDLAGHDRITWAARAR